MDLGMTENAKPKCKASVKSENRKQGSGIIQSTFYRNAMGRQSNFAGTDVTLLRHLPTARAHFDWSRFDSRNGGSRGALGVLLAQLSQQTLKIGARWSCDRLGHVHLELHAV